MLLLLCVVDGGGEKGGGGAGICTNGNSLLTIECTIDDNRHDGHSIGLRELREVNKVTAHKGNAKLTPREVLEIRRLRGEGWTIAALARGFKMSGNQIAKICDGTAWGHISQGTEVLSNSEAQLRQLTTPMPSKEEIDASLERLHKLLGQGHQEVGEVAPQPQPQPPIPGRYSEVLSGSNGLQPIKVTDEMRQRAEVYAKLVAARQAEADAREAEAKLSVRAQVPALSTINAEKLLETLRDENQSAKTQGNGLACTVRSDEQGNVGPASTGNDG
jgi:hypothetical protein